MTAKRKNIYTKKNYITIQSFNLRSFSINYHMIDTGNNIKYMELLEDRTN